MTLQQEKIRAFAVPRKIVAATDLTDTDYLLPYAIAQARASHASLILVHVVLPHESAPVEAGAIPYYDPLRMDRDARLMLEGFARDAQAQGIECVTAVRHGFAPDVIGEIVANSGAGRLIVGTHGRRGLKKFVLGSVARQLLEAIDVPVCTVGPRAHKGMASPPAAILHPVSLGGAHETSAALSVALGGHLQSQVVLLHMLQSGPAGHRDPQRSLDAALAQVNALIPAEARSWTRAEARQARGPIVGEILAAAEEVNAGLIVLGVHAPAHSWLPGTEPAAYKILVSAPCPVLSLQVTPAHVVEGSGAEHAVTPVSLGKA